MKREGLIQHYNEHRPEIERRLEEFKKLGNSSDKRLFQELVFVILTSQSSAEKAWSAAQRIGVEGLLNLSKKEIADVLEEEEVLYGEQKAGYIIKNRDFLSQPTFRDPSTDLKLKDRIKTKDLNGTRKWFVENVKGMGWKGGSHFLRNIGHGDEFAILSGHTTSVLFDLNVLKTSEPPKSEKSYLKSERRVQDFSEEIGINLEALDLALWSYKTGKVFK